MLTAVEVQGVQARPLYAERAESNGTRLRWEVFLRLVERLNSRMPGTRKSSVQQLSGQQRIPLALSG